MLYPCVVRSKANTDRSWQLSEFLNWSLQAHASIEEYSEVGFVWVKWSSRELAASGTEVTTVLLPSRLSTSRVSLVTKTW
jgi:hypothetical protein